ncbi:MAG: hypothetical protein RQ758_02045 [Methanomicrobiaceae archaeon]|nr:hypothetical protein [Methanomicrobiaceae archaeon]
MERILLIGLPITVWLSTATLLAAATTAALGWSLSRGSSRIPFYWHVYLGRATVILALISAGMGLYLSL